LKKSFDFSSFEHAQYFVQRVSKFAQEKDHHPEWSIANGGTTVNVTLTSHFAGNKVTLYDFQLAERMNKDFKITAKNFKMFPFLSRSAWASVLIFFGSYFILLQMIGVFLGEANNPWYYSSYYRFGKMYLPQPYVVDRFQMPAEVKKIRSAQELDEFVEKYTDDYSFRNALFKKQAVH